MKYISSRGKQGPVTISTAIQMGPASDGGLFVPETWPIFHIDKSDYSKSLPDISLKILEPFFEGDILFPKLKNIVETAFNFPAPLVSLNESTAILELFHGPTAAFKDFGARFLAIVTRHLEKLSSQSVNKREIVFVATSGDTGGAVAAAFSEFTKIPVVILYPKGGVSPRQETQLTCWGQQVKAFAVRGDFDDCQRMVKESFSAPSWKSQYSLLSANSINIGRLLPQVCYYGHSSMQYYKDKGRNANYIIPSGNLGNSVAALWAKKLGFPMGKIVLAHNENRAVPDFFSTGKYLGLKTISTPANAMDVGSPSNIERLFNLFPDLQSTKGEVEAISVTSKQIIETIQAGEKKWKQIWCPHTAVGIFAREQQKVGDWIVVATAHPAKFESIVEPIIGHKISIPVQLQQILNRPQVSIEIGANLDELAKHLSI